MNRSSKYVKCPYYKSNDQYRIKCEGLTEGSTIHLVFGDRGALSIHRRVYCDDIGRCRYCRIHKMLDEKWEVGR